MLDLRTALFSWRVGHRPGRTLQPTLWRWHPSPSIAEGRPALDSATVFGLRSGRGWRGTAVADRRSSRMKRRVLVVFCLHAVIAAYCVMCGVLDSHGHFMHWLIPNTTIFFLLFGSAFAFPIIATVGLLGSGQKHPLLVEACHLAMGAAQVLFGLLPLQR
jgi:hypothetical protein